jgi:glycosyltransferase involved in cell wall biosynthesis
VQSGERYLYLEEALLGGVPRNVIGRDRRPSRGSSDLTMASSNRRFRILIAHSFYRIPGGEDRYVRQQVDLLSSQHAVDLLAETNESLRPGPGTALQMLYSPGKKREVAERIRRFRPDVIHLHNTYPAIGPAVHLAAHELGVPVIMTVHNFRLRCPNGYMFTEGSPCRRCERGAYFNAAIHRCFPTRTQAVAYASALWAHRFVQGLERMVSLFITPSTFMRERLLDWGLPRQRTQVVPHFVEAPPDASSRPGSFGAYVGRLSAEKGLHILLRALRLAGDPPFRIVGDGPIRHALGVMADRLALQNTEFLGRLGGDGLAQVFTKARFCVMPSLWDENFPMAMLESMAAGRPLLVSRMGGLPELAEGGSGVIFEPGDPEDLAAKIGRLMTDDDLCVRAGNRGLALARDRFAPGAHLARLEHVYARVMERDRGGDGSGS